VTALVGRLVEAGFVFFVFHPVPSRMVVSPAAACALQPQPCALRENSLHTDLLCPCHRGQNRPRPSASLFRLNADALGECTSLEDRCHPSSKLPLIATRQPGNRPEKPDDLTTLIVFHPPRRIAGANSNPDDPQIPRGVSFAFRCGRRGPGHPPSRLPRPVGVPVLGWFSRRLSGGWCRSPGAAGEHSMNASNAYALNMAHGALVAALSPPPPFLETSSSIDTPAGCAALKLAARRNRRENAGDHISTAPPSCRCTP